MAESGSIKEVNKKITELTTFAVPYAVEEIKKNITISISASSSLSREQIISQAFKFHSQGNILEAAKLYQYFINQGFKDHQVFSNYGLILKDRGNLKEAELSTRKAIEIKPNFAEAHFNLGHILIELGNLKEAELSTRKAIEIEPNFTEAHFNLVIILQDLGKLKEARLFSKKTMSLRPWSIIGSYSFNNEMKLD